MTGAQRPLAAVVGLVGGDVAEAVVEVLAMLEAKLLEMIEEESREQADADAEFADEDFGFERAGLFSFEQGVVHKHHRDACCQSRLTSSGWWAASVPLVAMTIVGVSWSAPYLLPCST